MTAHWHPIAPSLEEKAEIEHDIMLENNGQEPTFRGKRQHLYTKATPQPDAIGAPSPRRSRRPKTKKESPQQSLF